MHMHMANMKMKMKIFLVLQALIVGGSCVPRPRVHVDTASLLTSGHQPAGHSNFEDSFNPDNAHFPPSLLNHPEPILTTSHLQPRSLLPKEQSSNDFLFMSTPGITLTKPITTSTVTPSIPIQTSTSPSLTIQIPASPLTLRPLTSGTILSSLATTGHATSPPLLSTSIPVPLTRISVPPTPSSPISISHPLVLQAVDTDIFQAIDTAPPPSILGSRADHPVPRLGIQGNGAPIGTNKFYANLFLGSQTAPVWTHPYSLSFSKPRPSSPLPPGLTITHLDPSQKVFGPNATSNPASYFLNPIGIQSLILSALELGVSTTLTTDSLTSMSLNLNLNPASGAPPTIRVPLVQGMGFVTAVFAGGTPILGSGVLFRSLSLVSNAGLKTGVTKYKVVLEDGKTWLIYAYSPTGQGLDLRVVNNGLVQATSGFSGIVQVAKAPNGDDGSAERMFDQGCGVYALGASVSGSVSGGEGSYTIAFQKGGLTGTSLVMFALPHHLESFDDATACNVKSGVQLGTTTKGMATAVVADQWTMVEQLPLGLGFAPWSPTRGSSTGVSDAARAMISNVAVIEVSQNMTQQTDLNSMYYSGKALAKFAGIVYTIHDIVGDIALAQAGLNTLKQNFARFTSNQQQYPLVYETAWGGILSTATYVTGDSGADFGNPYYNDHHFHYSYFVYAAAIIGYLDPSWLASNKAYVNTMVRDYANPSTRDTYFPVSRNFDWYHGHSWAHGLYETFDGKDEESSSEDSLSAYAIKMWGHVIGDANMEARGNLQLAITARSLQNYFLYESSDTIQPSNFIGNKVSGILFENKIDHTTYFGANPEYIQGIHMLPLLPHSTLTRAVEFVTEEWNTYFSNGRADAVVGGWKGVLYANLAIIDPQSSWNFFARADFDWSWLDGGASRTWYLVMAAALGGSP